MYTCLLVDDDMLDLDVLELFVSKIENLKISAVCNNGVDAALQLQKQQVDIVFSDIDMPDLSGIGLLQSLQKPPIFIFISSHQEHAAQSFNLDVIDFIVKPLTLARLIKAANKATSYIELKKTAATQSQLSSTPVPTNGLDCFYIKENYDYVKIFYADVTYIESMGDFSRLHLVNQKKHVTLVSLKHIETQLPTQLFMRTHKQYIVNMQHVVSISNNTEIELICGQVIPISLLYKPAFMQVINQRVISRNNG